MVLKVLPSDCKPFVIITQNEKEINFAYFKVALCSFEDAEKSCTCDEDKSVAMKAASKPLHNMKVLQVTSLVLLVVNEDIG